MGMEAGRRWLIAIIALLLAVAFLVTNLLGFEATKAALRRAIVEDELPLTSDTVFSAIQSDLLKPVVISSMMANDVFLREWAEGDERNVGKIAGYLDAIKLKYKAFTAFFVSEKTHDYYFEKGILRTVLPTSPHDAWYYRVQSMRPEYEINIGSDMSHGGAPTIFINYRVLDATGRFIGATGIGLAMNSVRDLIDRYQQRYRRIIYFVDPKGKIVVAGSGTPVPGGTINSRPGLSAIAAAVLNPAGGSFEFPTAEGPHLLNVRFIPQLNWYVFVENAQDRSLAATRPILFVNLAIALLATAAVVTAMGATVSHFQSRLERMSTTDPVTGLVSPRGNEILLEQATREAARSGRPLSVLIFDIDYFKAINDHYGRATGDLVLKAVAARTVGALRRSDIVCHWNGDVFVAVLTDCDHDDAAALAEKLRSALAETPIDAGGHAVPVTISVGMAEWLASDTRVSLMERADAALAAAKRTGRNRTVSI